MAAPKQSMTRMFREFDLFRKVAAEHNEADNSSSSPCATLLRVLSLALIATLTLSEFWTFAMPARKQLFEIDMHGSVSADSPRKLRVMLNVTVHDYPCIDLSLDYQDIMGTRAVDVRTTIFKQRLHPDGSLVGEVQKNDPKAVVKGGTGPSLQKNGTGNVTCGDCYGALPDGECCNTCSDVLYAYRLKRWALPRIEGISQCKNDGSAKSQYQPPQLIRLDDYRSDDYLPNFKKIGSLTEPANEARITAPFKMNLSLAPLKPLKKPFVEFNFTPGVRKLDDYWDNYWDDYDEEDGFGDLWKPKSQRNKDSKDKAKVVKWPNCIKRNTVINGFDVNEALMVDLRLFGAKEGCWNDNCSSTDKFNCDSLDHCANICVQVEGCHWWTWGVEEFAAKCWLRSDRHGRSKRYGFSSGMRNCTPAAANATAETTQPPAVASTTAEASTTPAPQAEASASTTQAPQVASEGSSAEATQGETTPRRLSSLLDDFEVFGSAPFGLPYGSSLHMPMFGWNSDEDAKRKEQKGESCRIHGYFDTNRVPGNFHIGTHGSSVPAYLSYYDEPVPPQQNMQHTINNLAFMEVSDEQPPSRKMPLDGFESPKAFTFQYYLTITPATWREVGGSVSDGYQFRAASFVTNELIGPAVFFRMDIDPIRVTYYTEEVRWSKFLVSICAVVGGCIAITSVLAQFIETAEAFAGDRD